MSHTKKFIRFVALWLVLISCGAAYADTSKISPDLLPLLGNPSNHINVVVQYSSPPTTSTGLLGGLLGGVVTLLGGIVSTLVTVVYTLVPALAATLQPADILNLSNQSNVVYISLDRPLAASFDYTAGAVDAPTAWNAGLDGTGVGIAVIDSGVYSHPDLNVLNSSQSRVVYRQSFIGGSKYDDFGHGTHVAGIVAGNGYSSSKTGSFQTFKGIAPNAHIVDLRVLNANGGSNDSVVMAAIDKAVQLKSQYNIRVINLSLGRPITEGCTRDPLCQAVEAAWRNGIVVVTAAGNLGRNGYATVLSPGNAPHAITVGAM
ncbi:MAG TPA: S8 family serine peptidase, partial [Bryobacteraceae bacterium]|nr:S8 family serine peptidase [Bryobacteraceae bacterium]